MNSVNHALRELLRRDVLGEAVPVAFEPPNRPWAQGAVRPTVNLFLYDLRENLTRREVMLEPVRDSSGMIVGRRPPPTRYDLYYVLSVWGCPIELEFQLLTAAVVALGSYEVLPAEMFEKPDPNAASTFLTTASGMKRGMLPMFSGELKLQVELTVTTPVPTPIETFVAGPPVREPARISVLAQSPEDIAARRKLAARMPRPRVAQGDPHAATRAAIAEAVAALPPPPPPAKPPASAGGPPGAARPAGGPPGAARPAGGPPGAARPAGAPQPGARPAGQPPAGQGGQPAARPPGAAPPPLVQLRAALAQAAQAQAVLAQAVAGLATMLPSGAPAKPPAPATPAPATPAPATPAPAPAPPAAAPPAPAPPAPAPGPTS